MKKIFIINAGQNFAHSGGKLNDKITGWDIEFFSVNKGFDYRVTNVAEVYDVEDEIGKFLWADVIVYHFPIWWMYIPFTLKEYLDKILTAGHRKGMYYSDGRKEENPTRNYGTGGLITEKKYMVTTTWNAPEESFTIPEEFFQGKSVDDGVLFPFHRMNAFCGMNALKSFHFHDVEKNMGQARFENLKAQYFNHLNDVFK